MRFFEVIKKRKILFLNIFLFLYIAMNLFTGDRGLISYFEKKGIEKHLYDKKITLTNEVAKFTIYNLRFDRQRSSLRVGNRREKFSYICSAAAPFCEGGIRVAQLISFILITLSIFGLFWIYQRKRKYSY